MKASKEPRFPLGHVVATPGALEAAGRDYLDLCLIRHRHGDWGTVGAEDAAANEAAVLEGDRILSVYPVADGSSIWIITESDRSSTTALLPSEY